jgi:hypothetical protein
VTHMHQGFVFKMGTGYGLATGYGQSCSFGYRFGYEQPAAGPVWLPLQPSHRTFSLSRVPNLYIAQSKPNWASYMHVQPPWASEAGINSICTAYAAHVFGYSVQRRITTWLPDLATRPCPQTTGSQRFRPICLPNGYKKALICM